MSRHVALFTFALSTLSFAHVEARPLLTEEVPTVGRRTFEASFSMSERRDEFNTLAQEYETVNFPITARFGVTNTFDAGFLLNYVSQRLETGSAEFKGSQNGRFSPFIKISPWDYFGFQAFWHLRAAEEGEQELPVVRGTDYETLFLVKLPVTWPVTFNAGYLFRGKYRSKLGVRNGIAYDIEPGDVFEAKGAIEIPLAFHFSLLGELAYYNSGENRVEGVTVPDSAAEAMDVLGGITWAYKGWNIGAGAAFGLLEEKYTSFDYERGAGDYTIKGTISYKLVPRRPNQ